MNTVRAIDKATKDIRAYFSHHELARQVIRDGLLRRLASASVLLERAMSGVDANMTYAFGIALSGQERWTLATEAFKELEPFEPKPQLGTDYGLLEAPIAYVARGLQIERCEDERLIAWQRRAVECIREAVQLLRALGEEEKAKGLENLQPMMDRR